MSNPVDPFNATTTLHNAHFPWHHSFNAFCTCDSCFRIRRSKILATCDMLESNLGSLERPTFVPALGTTFENPDITVSRKL